MASAGFQLLKLAVIFFSAGSVVGTVFVDIKCKPQNVGQYDQQSRLDCVIHYSKDVEDPTIMVVTWKKEGVEEPILKYDNGKLTSLPGYSFAEPSWNNTNVNVSLLIHKTAVKDEGVYTCLVETDSGNCMDANKPRLSVTAKYREPTLKPHPQNIDLNMDGTLTCTSSDGYPEGQLRWFDGDNKVWKGQPKEEVQRTENDLFILSSTLSIQGGSVFFKYTCKVFNAKGDKEAENSFKVPDKPTIGELGGVKDVDNSNTILATKVVAPVVVIGSLIVGLLLLLLYRRRSQQVRRQSTTPLISDHRAVPMPEVAFEEGDYQEEKEDVHESLTAGETKTNISVIV